MTEATALTPDEISAIERAIEQATAVLAGMEKRGASAASITKAEILVIEQATAALAKTRKRT